VFSRSKARFDKVKELTLRYLKITEKIKAKSSKNAAQVASCRPAGNSSLLTARTTTAKAKTKSKIIPIMRLV